MVLQPISNSQNYRHRFKNIGFEYESEIENVFSFDFSTYPQWYNGFNSVWIKFMNLKIALIFQISNHPTLNLNFENVMMTNPMNWFELESTLVSRHSIITLWIKRHDNCIIQSFFAQNPNLLVFFSEVKKLSIKNMLEMPCSTFHLWDMSQTPLLKF